MEPVVQQAPTQPAPAASQPVPKVGVFRRGWRLTKSSWHILKLDKELTAIPFISFIVTLAVLIPIGLIFLMNATFDVSSSTSQSSTESVYQSNLAPWQQGLLGIAAYFLITFVANFFAGAIIYGAVQRFNGGDPSVKTSISGASRKFRPLILFSLMMTTVGLFFQFLEERLPFAGALAVRLFDAAWNIANIFAIPVIVLSEGNVSPIDATKQSVQVVKKVWGESIVVNLGIGLIAAFSYIIYLMIAVAASALTFSLGGGQAIHAPLIIVASLSAVGFIGLILIFTTLTSIAKAALYQYAVTGQAPGSFDKELLRSSMTPKKARKIFG
jgi:hypothetical protein